MVPGARRPGSEKEAEDPGKSNLEKESVGETLTFLKGRNSLVKED